MIRGSGSASGSENTRGKRVFWRVFRGVLRCFSACAFASADHINAPYAAADPNGEHMIKVLQKSGGDAFIEDKVNIEQRHREFSTDIHRFITERMGNV